MYIKHWQILLSEWRRSGRDGLTIPFLLGSQQFSKEQINLDVKHLITDIASNSEFDVYLGYCMTIKEVIIGIRDESKEKIAGRFLKTSSGNTSNLFLTKFLDDLGEDVDAVSNALTEKYQDLIDDGKFSLNDDNWGSFSFSEVSFVKACLENGNTSPR